MDHHEDIRDDFVIKTLEGLSRIEKRIEAIMNSGDLEIELLLSNNISNYNKSNQEITSIELYRIQPIYNYGIGEHFFKRLIEKIYHDSNLLSTPPLVSTISNSHNYYWAVPYESIIAVPFWEEENLINLPDLYHEIGHFIVGQYYHVLLSKFQTELTTHYQNEIKSAHDENRKDDIEVLHKTQKHWKDSWFEEFVCDLIATYLTGPAFAWTNMKLTTISHGKDLVYRYSQSHPADEARTRAIIHMMNQMGYNDESNKVLSSWNSFKQVILYQKITCYDSIYSENLLLKLTDIVFSFCQDIDLYMYKPQINGETKTISQWLNEAWEISINKGADFPEWERNSIKQLKRVLQV